MSTPSNKSGTQEGTHFRKALVWLYSRDIRTESKLYPTTRNGRTFLTTLGDEMDINLVVYRLHLFIYLK